MYYMQQSFSSELIVYQPLKKINSKTYTFTFCNATRKFTVLVKLLHNHCFTFHEVPLIS
jgi:hypothetical protein